MAIKRRSPLKETFEYGALRATLGLFRPFPWRSASSVGRLFAPLVFALDGRHRAVARQNLEMALGAEELARRGGADRILLGMYAHLVAMCIEIGHLGSMSRERVLEVARVSDPGRIEELKREFPVLAFTGHVGNFDLFALAVSAHGIPMAFLARPMDNERIYHYLNRTRERFGNRVLDKKGGMSAAYRTLRDGGVLGMVGDQNAVRGDGEVFVDFFGIPASTHVSGAKLAIRTGAGMVPGFIARNADSTHTIELGETIRPSGIGSIDAQALEMTQRGAAATEDFIRRHPEQWMWGHRRWKTRPPGEPRLYPSRRRG